MSNWLKAKLVDVLKNPRKDLLEAACSDMGFSIDYTKKKVHGAYSYEGTENVDCVLYNTATGEESTIGFVMAKKGNDTFLNVTAAAFQIFAKQGREKFFGLLF